MVPLFFRFVMVVSLALMPLSMGGAAMASVPATASAPSGHCDEHHKPADAPSTPKAHCGACAALPATDAPIAVAGLRPVLLREIEAERLIAEREPDIDTPPPKLG
jgi:hypothetical protein